jgi:zinc protease
MDVAIGTTGRRDLDFREEIVSTWRSYNMGFLNSARQLAGSHGSTWTRALALAAFVFTFNGFMIESAHAMKIQSVKSPGGIEAWLVEEHSLPLITMQFAFGGGSSQDPVGKPGIANFLSTMLDEGAGDIKSADFQERLEELAVKMRFDASRDNFTGSLQTLTENRDKAVELLSMALTKPRFDSDAIDRMRRQLLANIADDAKDPEKVADRLWFETAFPGHPYGLPVDGTSQSVGTVTAADLEAYRSRVFTRDNLRVAVVGDIDAASLGTMLDRAFGGLTSKASLAEVPAVDPLKGPVEKRVAMDIPQSVAQFGQVGLKRKDPDFIAGYILNYIIGGGGFSSRLMDQVREKRGLAYSVYSYLQPMQRSAVYLGGVATKAEGMAKSLEVIRGELERIAKDGPTQQELDDAKKYLTGSYALNFTSSSAIAGQLLGIQIQDLGIDYIDTRNDKVTAVSIEDVRRVARTLLQPGQLIVTVVGRTNAAEQN